MIIAMLHLSRPIEKPLTSTKLLSAGFVRYYYWSRVLNKGR